MTLLSPKRAILITIVLGSVFFWPSRPAQAATTLTGCQRIMTSGSYILGNDISAPANGICFSIRASDVTFDGNGKTITQSGGEALEVADYSGGAWNNVTVKNLNSNSGVRIYGNNIHHVTLDHLNVEGIVNYSGDDVVITNNTVGQGGINVNNADNSTWFPLRNTIQYNTITGGSTDVKIMLEVAGGSNHPCPRVDALVDHNTVNSTRNDPPPEATAAVRIRCATHVTFTNNTIRSTGTTIGLYIRDEADDGVYENNSFETNSQEALRIASGNADKTFPSRNIFQGNTFVSTHGAATFIQGMGSDNQIVNNLFWSKKGGLIDGASSNIYNHNTFYVSDSGEKIHTFNYDHGPSDTWTNNIFSYAGASTAYGFDGFTTDRYAAHHNLFHNRSGAVAFFNYGSLTAWKNGTGDDASSIEADPLFVDAPNGDFHLQSGSPAKNAGSDGTDMGYRPGAIIVITPTSTPNPSPTSTAPTIAIVAPRIATTVGGRILVTTSTQRLASNGGGVSAVFRIDGVVFSTDPNSPYRAWLDTRPLRNGYHRIDVTLTTKNGQTATAYRGFYVKNTFQISGRTVSGKQTISGIASFRPRYIYGATGDVRVRIRRLSGALIDTTTDSPYLLQWDTRTVRNGWYTIVMNVTDSKNRTTATSMRVYVRN